MIKIKIFKNYSLRYNYNEIFFAIFKHRVSCKSARGTRAHCLLCVQLLLPSQLKEELLLGKLFKNLDVSSLKGLFSILDFLQFLQ